VHRGLALHGGRFINSTIQDNRYIPITENGLVIRKRFLKYYLEQGLEEYVLSIRRTTGAH
jgi:hypothetical protein